MFRRRYGRLSLLAGLAMFLFQRRLFRRVPFAGSFGWRGLARDFVLFRYPIFTPTGIALRAVSRLFRRFGV